MVYLEEREILTKILEDFLSLDDYIERTLQGEIKKLIPKENSGGSRIDKFKGNTPGFEVHFFLTDLMPVASISIRVRINVLEVKKSRFKKLFGGNETIRMIIYIQFSHTPIQTGYDRIYEDTTLEENFELNNYSKETMRNQIGREISVWALSIIKSNEETLRPIIYKR